MARRNKISISADILNFAKIRRRKTEIMSNNGLSSLQANKYFNNLISNELLEKNDGTYKTSDKGRKFLETYKELENYLH